MDDFVRELRANGNSPATCRSYSYDLLDWFRFLQAADTSWDRATRQDVRDYVLSILSADNPQRRRRRPDTPSGANRRRGATVSDRLLTVAELAEYLGVARHTVYQWRYRGEGP
ncbi:MAG: site-specific integrase, partial [Actinomycetota bacterium]|nr:site-specific integrase [Actinomycetota bacterium]